MAIRVAIDARQRPLFIVCCRNKARIGPACSVLLLERCGQSAACESGFPERADASIPELRKKRSKDPRGGNGISLGRMAFSRLDAEPRCQALDRILRERWLDGFGQYSGIERPRLSEDNTGSLAFALEDCEIEANSVADHHGPTDEIDECRPNIGETGCPGHPGIIDLVDCRCCCRNGNAGRNQTVKHFVG